jgi:N-acetyl-anhydromuramyl-L-alanine amidase AmpD
MLLTHPSPNTSRRAVPCVAVCLHWTGGSYLSAVDWCQRAASKVSYHEIIGPQGELALLVPPDRAAWSVGRSIAPPPWQGATSGNSMTYNIALSGAPPVKPTGDQLRVLTERIVVAFAHFGWSLKDGFRITGHHQWAWPRGRKVDPQGSATDPWLDLTALRASVCP